MRQIALIATAAALVVATLGGCTTLDPWNVMSGTPATNSTTFKTPEQQTDLQLPELTAISGQPLTLAQCIEIALERNPQTKSSWEATRAAAARVGQSKAGYLPAVGFNTDVARGNPVELDGKTNTGVENTFDALFSVRYLLFDGGGREASVRAAQEDLLAANFRHNTTLQDIALGVEESYYNLLAAVQIRAVAEETVKQTEYHVALSEARHKAGIVAKSDVLQAQTEKANADLAFVQADSAVQIANGRLANAMGLHVSQTVKIIEPQISESMHRQELADIEQLLDEAARNRPELRTALAQIEIQRAAVRSAKARYWPTVTAGGDFGWLGRTFPPSMNQWNLGLGVDWSLFTGFDRTYQLQASKANLAQAIAEQENLLRGIELEVWTAYHQIIESSKAIDAAGRFVASAEENARVAEGEYKNGTGSIIALTDAQTSRSVARAQLVRARLDWYTAMARFERAVGRTLATPQNTAADKPKEAQK